VDKNILTYPIVDQLGRSLERLARDGLNKEELQGEIQAEVQ
jgi:hypothetical protein